MPDIFDLFKKIEKKPQTPNAPISFIIAGLGNPGDKYAFTRHNAGFLAVDYLCDKYGFKVDRSRRGPGIWSDYRGAFLLWKRRAAVYSACRVLCTRAEG